MNDQEKFDLALSLLATNDRCVLIAAGVAWEGHILDMAKGRVDAYVRLLKEPAAPRVRRGFALADIDDLAEAEVEEETKAPDVHPSSMTASEWMKNLQELQAVTEREARKAKEAERQSLAESQALARAAEMQKRALTKLAQSGGGGTAFGITLTTNNSAS